MSIPLTMLGLLEPAPSHGYTLKQRYDERFGRSRPLKFGQVYATLGRLERDGLAQVTGVEHGEGPERKVFAITPDGVSELEHWLGTPEPPGQVQNVLFTKVVLALSSGRPAPEVLDAQRAVHLARMREITAARHDVNVLERLAGDYEIAHLEADLHWIEIAGARLDALRKELSA